MKKLVTCTGYGTTGSSVVSDLLKEFKDIKSMGEYEFRFLFDPHGVRELEIALYYLNNRQNSDFYIKSFIKYIEYLSTSPIYKYYEKVFNGNFKKESYKFIESLINVKWKGYWHQDVMNENMLKKSFYYLERVIQKKILKQKDGSAKFYKKNMYYSFLTSREEFHKKSKKYINSLIESMNISEGTIVLDQLVPPENTKEFLNYFENLKIIIVDRDPRDLYLLEKYQYKETWVPYKNIKDYVEWYKMIRNHRFLEGPDDRRVLRLNFEDFIYKYEETINKIMLFLNIKKNNWIEKKRYFNPEASILNTKKWLIYKQAKNEIDYIEKELFEYLYEY